MEKLKEKIEKRIGAERIREMIAKAKGKAITSTTDTSMRPPAKIPGPKSTINTSSSNLPKKTATSNNNNNIVYYKTMPLNSKTLHCHPKKNYNNIHYTMPTKKEVKTRVTVNNNTRKQASLEKGVRRCRGAAERQHWRKRPLATLTKKSLSKLPKVARKNSPILQYEIFLFVFGDIYVTHDNKYRTALRLTGINNT